MSSFSIRTLKYLLLSTVLLACNPTNVIAGQAPSQAQAIKFELQTDPLWKAPPRGQVTRLHLALEITNAGSKPLSFPIMDTFHVSIQSSDGVRHEMEGGQDGIRPGKVISDSVAPGEKYVLNLPGQMSWRPDNSLRLKIQDAFGSIWWIQPLQAGTHLLQLSYESLSTTKTNTENIWVGRAEIAPVSFQIMTH